MSLLRVHSRDLCEHVASEAGECLEKGLYTDLEIRCAEGEVLRAHSLVLAAVSPYLRRLLSSTILSQTEQLDCLHLPMVDGKEMKALLEVIYTGSIEASLPEMRSLLSLAHSLYISVPVSDQLKKMLGLQLEKLPDLQDHKKEPSNSVQAPPLVPSMSGLQMPGSFNGLNMFQQQILSQYAVMNGLMEPPVKKMKTELAPGLLGGSSHPQNLFGGPEGTIALQNQLLEQEKENKDKMNNQLNQIIFSSLQAGGSYICSVCQSSYTNKGNFRQHVEKHVKNGELGTHVFSTPPGLHNGGGYDSVSNMYQCHICHSTYSHPGNFKQHLLKHEREQRLMVNNNESSHLNSVLQSAFADRVDNGDPCKSYICHECNRTFKHPGNFKQHMASHNKPLVVAPNQMNLKRPMPGLMKMSPQTPEQKDWECPECKEKFMKGIELQSHMKNLHDIEMVLPPDEALSDTQESGGAPGKEERPVSPPLGDRDEALKALALAAGSDRAAMYHCDVPGCFQSFTTEGWLLRHRQKLHAELVGQDTTARVYSCNQCGKEFLKLSKLTQHIKTHSPEMHYKFPCDICGKKFTRPQHVTRHKLLHTGEKPHNCVRCDKTFAREDKLKHHLLKGCSPSDLRGDERKSLEDEIDDDEEGESGSLELSMEVGVVG